MRLHEKGGKEHDVPCHHNLDHFLDEYIAAAGIAGDANGYLFRTTMRRSGILTGKPLHPMGRKRRSHIPIHTAASRQAEAIAVVRELFIGA